MTASPESLQRLFVRSLEGESRPVLAELRAPTRATIPAQAPASTQTSAPMQRPSAGQNDNDSNNDNDSDALQRHRLDLYRHNIDANRRAALANAYPVLLALVGEDYFDALSRGYAREHPSQSGDLNRFGAMLPDFVDAYETDPRYRYFADLARLEWALHTAYFAADAATLSAERWAALNPGDLLHTPFATHPACTPIASPFAIAAIWTAHQPDGAFPQDLTIDSPAHVLVVRPQWRPEILVQSAAAHAAFGALQRGATLDVALDAAFAIDAGFDFPSQWRAWIAGAAITGPARDAVQQTRLR
nr:hypothetical protein HUO10_006470 [Paraburkholderia busanensis]